MKRGRPRQYNPAIPHHIDQRKLPAGAYWDARDHIWYTHVREGAKTRRQRLAGASATLADLHRLIEERQDDSRGSIAWLQTQFAGSEQWRALSVATQRDYTACLRVLQRQPTRLGVTCADLMVDRLRKVDAQVIVDKIAETRPAMANHVKRWLGRLFAWGMQRGKMHDRANPAHGLDAAKEKGAFKMPDLIVYERVLAFARGRGARRAHTKGSCPPYLWPAMVFAYRCRQRGIEALLLTDASRQADGIYTNRRKGSLDNVTRWSDELHEAWDAAVDYRRAIWKARKKEHPIQARDRPLLVNEKGAPLAKLNARGDVVTRSTFDTAWQRFMGLAIEDGIIRADQRFTLHGLKHRGITDTAGNKAAKKEASGHKTDAMLEHYDHDVPVVAPAGEPS